MNIKIIATIISFASCASAAASTWNYVWVGNDESQIFFDADTVEKLKDKTVLVWIKSVQTSSPDSDGSWATALRWKFNCSKRTLQPLMWSSYDQDGKFIKSNSTPGDESAVIPDSLGEGMLEVACEASFPNDTSGKSYFKLKNNDPMQATKNIVEYKKSQIDRAPK